MKREIAKIKENVDLEIGELKKEFNIEDEEEQD